VENSNPRLCDSFKICVLGLGISKIARNHISEKELGIQRMSNVSLEMLQGALYLF